MKDPTVKDPTVKHPKAGALVEKLLSEEGSVNLISVPSEPDEPIFSLTATVGPASGSPIGREHEPFGNVKLVFSNVKQLSGGTDPEDFAPLRDFFTDGNEVDAKKTRTGFVAYDGEFPVKFKRV